MTPAGHSDLVMKVNLSEVEDERATEAVVA